MHTIWLVIAHIIAAIFLGGLGWAMWGSWLSNPADRKRTLEIFSAIAVVVIIIALFTTAAVTVLQFWFPNLH